MSLTYWRALIPLFFMAGVTVALIVAKLPPASDVFWIVVFGFGSGVLATFVLMLWKDWRGSLSWRGVWAMLSRIILLLLVAMLGVIICVSVVERISAACRAQELFAWYCF